MNMYNIKTNNTETNNIKYYENENENNKNIEKIIREENELEEDEYYEYYCKNCSCVMDWKHKCANSYLIFYLHEPDIKDDLEFQKEFNKYFIQIKKSY